MAKDRSNRFNAKGRQSGLNKLKEDEKIKQRKRSKVVEDRESTDANTNADLILPKSKEQKEQDQLRKLELRKEVCAFEKLVPLSHTISSWNPSRMERFLARSARDLMLTLCVSIRVIGPRLSSSLRLVNSRRKNARS